MPLVTSESLLLDAQRNGYAVGAFNVENMEMAQAVISAAKEEQSPVPPTQNCPHDLNGGRPESQPVQPNRLSMQSRRAMYHIL